MVTVSTGTSSTGTLIYSSSTATPHFFNVQNETIIDTSLGTKKGLYFGKKVDIKYTSADKMFDAELWTTLYAEKRIENNTDLEEICTKYNLKQLNINN